MPIAAQLRTAPIRTVTRKIRCPSARAWSTFQTGCARTTRLTKRCMGLKPSARLAECRISASDLPLVEEGLSRRAAQIAFRKSLLLTFNVYDRVSFIDAAEYGTAFTLYGGRRSAVV